MDETQIGDRLHPALDFNAALYNSVSYAHHPHYGMQLPGYFSCATEKSRLYKRLFYRPQPSSIYSLQRLKFQSFQQQSTQSTEHCPDITMRLAGTLFLFATLVFPVAVLGECKKAGDPCIDDNKGKTRCVCGDNTNKKQVWAERRRTWTGHRVAAY